ncbi:MAG: glycosyltransferase [Actinomycetota bacterium]|nr:MAG: glycosyltransferase [Actinomycetota bacterium]
MTAPDQPAQPDQPAPPDPAPGGDQPGPGTVGVPDPAQDAVRRRLARTQAEVAALRQGRRPGLLGRLRGRGLRGSRAYRVTVGTATSDPVVRRLRLSPAEVAALRSMGPGELAREVQQRVLRRSRAYRGAESAAHNAAELGTQTWRALRTLRSRGRGDLVPEPFTDLPESPLAAQYRALVGERQQPTAGTRSVAFCVSSTDLDSGRGDLYVAAGLARALRRLGWRTALHPVDAWDLVAEGTDVVVAMVPAVDPAALPATAVRVAWARSDIGGWLEQPSALLWDRWLAASEVFAAQLTAATGRDVDVLPIAADPELFACPEGDAEAGARLGAVGTANDFGSGRQLLQWLADRPPRLPLALFGERRGAGRRELRGYDAGRVGFLQLPAAYARARLVLDDQLPVAREVGSLNSRIYESICAGALPLTNSRLALTGSGLEAVPVYTNAASLAALLGEFGTGDRAGELAGQLREVVLDRHTYDVRAARFTELVACWSPVARPAVRLAFWPDERASNPYQDLIYAAAADLGVVVAPLRDLADSSRSVLADPAAAGPRVLHLHWTHRVLQGAVSAVDVQQRVLALDAALSGWRAGGGRVAWTVHNATPHEAHDPAAEQRVLDVVASHADLVHVMCHDSAREVAARYGVPPDRLVVVEHPSYLGYYPDAVSRRRARASFGLTGDEPVVVLFGVLRGYKGADDLLDALDDPRVAATGLRALVVGRPLRAGGMAETLRRLSAHPRVTTRWEFVDHDDVARCYKAADAAVLPYRRALNSGSALAALGFGTPVVAPALGCLPAVVTAECGVLYDPTAPGALAQALTTVPELRSAAVRRAARERAEQFAAAAVSRRLLERIAAL